MNLQNLPNLNINDKDEYIKSLEMAIEKLREENISLHSAQKTKQRNTTDIMSENCDFISFSDIDLILDALHSGVNNLFGIIESTVLFFESQKLNRINDIALSNTMAVNINYLEEEGIFDWITMQESPKIIPNLNLAGSETGKYFLLVPLFIHNFKLGIFIASTDLSELELSDTIKANIKKLCLNASLSIDYLKEKNQKIILANKVNNLEKAIIANAGLISIAEITSAISLEMEEPIKVISGHIDMLENGIGNPDSRLKTIKSQFEKIKKVVYKIKSIDDDNNEQSDIHSIIDIIKDVINLISSQMKNEGIDFKINSDLQKPNIKCKTNLITQLFLDIFLFQRSRMPDGGQISITVFNQSNKINLSIIDSGIGLNEDEKSNIFEPFKSDNSVNLFFAKQITKIHKGKINLISDSNSGNSIKIQFPVFDL